MKNTALSVTNLCKSYGPTEVLKDINFEIKPGDFLVLVGPSGCGKSTLLGCIAGLESLTSGSINISGRDMQNVDPGNRDIAMVFQSYALYPTMSVAKNITFSLAVRGIDKKTRQEKLNQVAENYSWKIYCIENRGNFQADNANVLLWAVPWCVNRLCFFSTNHCLI